MYNYTTSVLICQNIHVQANNYRLHQKQNPLLYMHYEQPMATKNSARPVKFIRNSSLQN